MLVKVSYCCLLYSLFCLFPSAYAVETIELPAVSPAAKSYQSQLNKSDSYQALVSLSTQTRLPTLTSNKGLYKGRIHLDKTIMLRTIHSWYLSVYDDKGQPIKNAELSITGGMPNHNHGLPTSPVYQELEEGMYELQGMKFQMLGSWFVDVMVASTEGKDTLHFEFLLDKIQ